MATPVHRNAPMDHSNSKNPEPTDYIKRTLLRLIQIGRIYGHAPHAQWIISTKKHSCCHYRQKKDKYASLYCPADADVGLIRTCQQIYHEPRGMLFEINTFTLHSILLPNLQNATRSWPIWKNVRKLKIDACCKNPNHLHKLLRTTLEHPAICLRELRLSIIGLNARSDILALQNSKVEESELILLNNPQSMADDVELLFVTGHDWRGNILPYNSEH